MTSSLPNPPVFVTGATGFVGSHIARRYLAAGQAVAALKRVESGYGMLTDVAERILWHEGDVLDIPSLEMAIQPGCDVIHAAAVVSFVPKDRDRMERVNVEGTANVVNVCLKAGVRKVGYVSSVAALGRPAAKGGRAGGRDPGEPIVISENQKWENSPNNSVYAKTKYRAELEVWRGVAEGLDVVMVNPSVVLGVGDWSRSSLQLVKYVYDEHPFYPAGLVSYVDVLDVADALYQLMEVDVRAERFILNGGTIPYRSLLEQIAAALSKRPPTWQVPPALTRLLWPVEAMRAWVTGRTPLITRETARSASSLYQYDGRKIGQVLDFQYRPLAETLRRVAEAFETPKNGS